MQQISFVIPVYNEKPNIVALIEQINTTMSQFDNLNYEIVFVDDGSTDFSLEEISKAAKNDDRIKFLALTKNFGKEIAMTAGLQHTRGDAVVLMDADFQHPPVLIPEFIKKWQEGADVVTGIRTNTRFNGWFRNLTSSISNIVLNRISDYKPVKGETDYRLLSRTVVDQFNRFTEKSRMTRSLINWLGFPVEYVYFEVPPRRNGHSSYGFKKRLKLMQYTLVSNTYIPLRLMVIFGSLIAFTFALLGIVGVIDRYISPGIFGFTLYLSGTAVLAMLIIFLVGIIIMCIGFVGMYIEHIHTEILNRPIYAIKNSNL